MSDLLQFADLFNAVLVVYIFTKASIEIIKTAVLVVADKSEREIRRFEILANLLADCQKCRCREDVT